MGYEVSRSFSSCVCTDLCVLHGHNPSPSSLNLWAPGLRAPMCVTASVDEHGAVWVGADPCGLSTHTTRALPARPTCALGWRNSKQAGTPRPVGTKNCLRIPLAPPPHLTHCSGKRSRTPHLRCLAVSLCAFSVSVVSATTVPPALLVSVALALLDKSLFLPIPSLSLPLSPRLGLSLHPLCF